MIEWLRHRIWLWWMRRRGGIVKYVTAADMQGPLVGDTCEVAVMDGVDQIDSITVPAAAFAEITAMLHAGSIITASVGPTNDELIARFSAEIAAMKPAPSCDPGSARDYKPEWPEKL